MFEIGDTVVYRHHVCKIASVREAYLEGKDYLELHALFENSLKLFVAVDAAHQPVIRPVMDLKRARAFLEAIPSIEPVDASALFREKTTHSLVERQLKDEYDRRMKDGGIEGLVGVMKCAHLRMREREAAGKPPGSIDKKFFELTEGLIRNELAVALDVTREEASARIAEQIGA